jgi:hypothetical protein
MGEKINFTGKLPRRVTRSGESNSSVTSDRTDGPDRQNNTRENPNPKPNAKMSSRITPVGKSGLSPELERQVLEMLDEMERDGEIEKIGPETWRRTGKPAPTTPGHDPFEDAMNELAMEQNAVNVRNLNHETWKLRESNSSFPTHIHLFELSPAVCKAISDEDREEMLADLVTAGLLHLPFDQIAVRFVFAGSYAPIRPQGPCDILPVRLTFHSPRARQFCCGTQDV